MKSVFVYLLLLALTQYGFATKVCNYDVEYSSTLKSPCVGVDERVRWPNYENPASYNKCVGPGKFEVVNCPSGKYFNYYLQNCVGCADYIPVMSCQDMQKTMDVSCVSSSTTTTTTKTPATKPTSKPTTASPGGVTTTTKRPLITKPTPSIPTPPTQSTSATDIPMPPMVVTPAPGIPTPPSENVTPPSIPGIPPMLTTVSSE